MLLKDFFVPRSLLLAAAAIGSFSHAGMATAQDIPLQAGRLAYYQGEVSVQPAGVDGWGQVEPNLPVGPGDRFVSGPDGRFDIAIGPVHALVNYGADLTLIGYSDAGPEMGLARGWAVFHSNAALQGQNLFINTPNGTVSVTGNGDVRIDVDPEDNVTIVTPLRHTGVVVMGAGGFRTAVYPTGSLALYGTNPVSPQTVAPAPPDSLDAWALGRIDNWSFSRAALYVSPEVAGYEDLDNNGTWDPNTPYGPVWYPQNVPAGWAPYHYGHWVNRAPWGWTWVESEPWGYAPFHYGRWVSYNGRWGWIPGAPAQHPVWSPALVVFAGGIHIGGVGISVWFPLGPGEPYRPSYPCSPQYIDRINISNIRETQTVHVQKTYVNIGNVTNITYVNRTVGATGMNHADFAAGRPAQQVNVKVDVNLIVKAPVLVKAEPQPTAQSVISRPVAHAIAAPAARPMLINREGKQIQATAHPQPQPVAVKPMQQSAIKPLPGHPPIASPVGTKPTPAPAAMPKQEPTKPAAMVKSEPQPAATKPADKPTAEKDPKAEKNKQKEKDKKPE